jgi:hypothetical protein
VQVDDIGVSSDAKTNQQHQLSMLSDQQLLTVAGHLGMSDNLLTRLKSRYIPLARNA